MARIPFSIRFKHFRRRLIRLSAVQTFLGAILFLYIQLAYHTARKTLICPPASQPYLSGEKNAIFAFWHGRMLMIPPLRPKNRKMFVLISHHNDGELITRTLSFFGVRNVRGSSSRGGGKAALGVVRVFRSGNNISITPDGPRGPSQQAHAGIIQLARMCNCRIIPVTVASSRCIQLKSWDRMQIALPFGHLVGEMGEPLEVSQEDTREAAEADRKKLEDILNTITLHADSLLRQKVK